MISKDKTFDLKQYKTNLFDSFKYNGNLYVLPVFAYGNTVTANHTIFSEENIHINDENWTWKDFLEVCKKVTKDTNGDGTPEQYVLPFIGPSMLVQKIFDDNSYQFIDLENKRSYLDSPYFIKILLHLRFEMTVRYFASQNGFA